MTGERHTRTLADGLEMPLLGLGVFRIPDGTETENAVGWALEAGYRHIDTAQAYGNEASVGRALAASGIPREDLFVTTKFYPRAKDPVESAERSVERLGIDRIDLYLVHFPERGATWAWAAMERALGRGLARAIGVSNFDVDELEAVTAAADVPPVVNQIQFSPFHLRSELLAACVARDVALEAYSPLERGRELGDPVLARVAERNGRTPAQVLLRWGVQRDLVVIPKSARRERIVENSLIFDFSLSDDDVATLDGLDRTDGTGRAVNRRWWTPAGRARSRVMRLSKRLRG